MAHDTKPIQRHRGRPRLYSKPLLETHEPSYAILGGETMAALAALKAKRDGSLAMLIREGAAWWLDLPEPKPVLTEARYPSTSKVPVYLSRPQKATLKNAARSRSRGLCWLLGRIMEAWVAQGAKGKPDGH